jgi:hypothetical protein
MNNDFPTLEQVQHYFRNAQKVKCLFNGQEFNFDDMDEKGIKLFRDSYWVTNKHSNEHGLYASTLIYQHGIGHAEITEYQKPKKY